MAHILVFGDSIAYGSWDPEEGGWVGRLRRFLDQRATSDEDIHYVYNLGISGDTTREVVERFTAETEMRIARTDDDIVIIFALGTNDALYDHEAEEFQISQRDCEQHVQRLLAAAEDVAGEVCWVGPPPVDEARVDPLPWRNASYQNAALEEYNIVIKDVCDREDVVFIDTFTRWRDDAYQEWLADGVHPNSAGHEKIFQSIKEQIHERI